MRTTGSKNRTLLFEEVPGAYSAYEVFREQWQVAIRVLQLIQNDYAQAKRQVEKMSRSFSERERWTGERLNNLLEVSTEMPRADGRRKASAGRNSSDETRSSVAWLRAYCFGNFEIHLNWKKINEWHSLKAKSLLKFLVSRKKKPVAKEVLLETLWPNCDPQVGKNNLKAAVYSLRHTLSPDEEGSQVPQLILFSEGQYLINPEVELWVDVEEFERHWLAGHKLEKERETEEAMKEYRLAEELYRGDYLEDDHYAEWTLLPREALKDTYLTILGRLAKSSFESEDYESCILYSQKILAKDVCHEEAYRWLIRCYGRMGNSRRARQWYEVCASTLKKELDTLPDRKTVTLYHQLLNE